LNEYGIFDLIVIIVLYQIPKELFSFYRY